MVTDTWPRDVCPTRKEVSIVGQVEVIRQTSPTSSLALHHFDRLLATTQANGVNGLILLLMMMTKLK
eukprot:scaffold6407_cov201-Ochromonas_danica.AAC.2